jgi:uncharacterized protein YbjT (DUF2867 family)
VCVKDLVINGAEVVQADFGDIESLKEAFKGAYGVYGMTNCVLPTASSHSKRLCELILYTSLGSGYRSR